jgi:DNA repair photolyase
MEKSTKFNGKAIYNPSGKAGEYSYWACNFYVGCSNGCTYCYCKKGILAGVMGQDKPQLKKCFRDEKHAYEIFDNEMFKVIDVLKKHGLFFSYTTDPMLQETINLSMRAISRCIAYEIPVKILTKTTGEWVDDFVELSKKKISINNLGARTKKFITFGFTLTGHDELEPGASPHAERIEAMRKLHEAGFKTWASIEPVIDFESSFNMIWKTAMFCNLYKIGLESGGKYTRKDCKKFMDDVVSKLQATGAKIYFKEGLLKRAGISRSELPSNCVGRDYNIFTNE